MAFLPEKSPTPRRCLAYEDVLPMNRTQLMSERLRNRILELFPFKQPYPEQIASMQAISSILIDRQNILFESPTGTGKSLMILSSTLAFLEIYGEETHQILYLTRTNGQVNNLVKELNKIQGANQLVSKYAILSGRNQLCLQKQLVKDYIKKNKVKKNEKHRNQLYDQFCSNCKGNMTDEKMQLLDPARIIDVSKPRVLKENSKPISSNSEQPSQYICEHFGLAELAKDSGYKFNGFARVKNDRTNEIKLPDIEDMVTLMSGENAQCSFYFNKVIAKQANIIFMNYNYLLNQDILNYFSQEVVNPRKNLIIVFDEAHNVEQTSESQLKKSLKLKNIRKVLNLVEQLSKILSLAKTLRLIDVLEDYGKTIIELRANIEEKQQKSKTIPFISPFQINVKQEEKEAEHNKEEYDVQQPDQQKNISELFNKNNGQNILTQIELYNIHALIDQIPTPSDSSLTGESEKGSDKGEYDTPLLAVARGDSKVSESSSSFNEEEEEQFLRTMSKFSSELKESKCEEEFNDVDDDYSRHLFQDEPFNYHNNSSCSPKESPQQLPQHFEQPSPPPPQQLLPPKSPLVIYQTEVLSLFLTNFPELLEKLRSYFHKLARFCESSSAANAGKQQSCLFSELNTMKPFYECFGFQEYTADVKCEEPEKSEEQSTQTIYQEVSATMNKLQRNELSYQQPRFNEVLNTLLRLNDFTKIFKDVMRHVKMKYGKISAPSLQENVQQLAETVLKSQIYNENDLFQLKTSLKFFATQLQPLEHSKKVPIVSGFLKEMQGFHELSQTLLQSSKYQLRGRQLVDMFGIQSVDLQKLQEFYFAITTKESNKDILFTIGGLTARYAFRSIYAKLNVHSIILTSGTLQPFGQLAKSLGIPFQVHQGKHVINAEKQVFTRFLNASVEGNFQINFSFTKMYLGEQEIRLRKLRNARETMRVIHGIVMQIAGKAIHGGVLVFCKNYELLRTMEQLYHHSQEEGQQMFFLSSCPVFFEKTLNREFQEDYTLFKRLIEKQKKICVYFAASRGKLAEGIDLTDELGRCVIIAGLPHKDFGDSAIIQKRKYVEHVLRIDSNEWNKQETMKCVNQAAGRAIRHINDWGAVFFICSSFEMPLARSYKRFTSDWLQMAESTDADYLAAFSQFLTNQTERIAKKEYE